MTQQNNLFAYRSESGDFELRKVVQYQNKSEESVAGVYRLGAIDEDELRESVYGFVDGGWAIGYDGSTDIKDNSMEEVADQETEGVDQYRKDEGKFVDPDTGEKFDTKDAYQLYLKHVK